MLEESGDDGQAADDDPDRKLGIGPDAELDNIVAEIG